MSEDKDHLPADPLEEAAMQGRKLLVITCDENLNLTMEENTFGGWALSGIASWLDLVAEATMNEELAEEASEDE